MGTPPHHHSGEVTDHFSYKLLVSFVPLPEFEMAEETETKAVKRGRGRPPKPDSEKKTKVVKNDEASDDGEPPVKRGRGRPKGSTKSKGRGRPKGTTKVEKKEEKKPAVPGRGRGRPKKNVAAEEDEDEDEKDKEEEEEEEEEADESSS